MNGELVPMNGGNREGAMVREEFGATEVVQQVETASTALAAQARAEVEAMYVMALRRPRDIDTVRVSLLKACKRPGFAKTARYRKPVGKGVEGPSIRFAEEAIRSMGNIMPSVSVIYDDAHKRLIRVSVTDLESNVPYKKDIVIEKTVERSKVSEGQTVLSVRTNSQGRKTFLVAATEDDLLNKENALVSKALRTLGLRLLPGDILEECMAQVIETVSKSDAADPDAARKQIADGFSALNVTPAAVKEYLGHDLGTCSPAELAELRAVWTAIKEGVATWTDVMEERRTTREVERRDAPAAGAAAPDQPASASSGGERGTASLKSKIQKPAGAQPPLVQQATEMLQQTLGSPGRKPAAQAATASPEEHEAAEAEKHLGGAGRTPGQEG